MTTQVQVASDTVGTLDKVMNSSFLSYIGLGVLVYIAILWIAIILWVTKDIINRTNNVLMQIFCISLVIFLTPIFGLVIYLIARPSKTLLEQYYEDFEINMIQTEEDAKDIEHCPHCHAKTDTSFKFCSMCGSEISQDCISCKKLIKLQWVNCPFCGTEQEEVKDTSTTMKEEVKVKNKKEKKQITEESIEKNETKEVEDDFL